MPSRARGVLAIRVSDAERRLLEAAAATGPEYLGRFVREAALAVAREEVLKGTERIGASGEPSAA